MAFPVAALARGVLARAVGLTCGLVVGVAATTACGGGCPCGTLADEFRAADAGLVREWMVQVPFDSAARRLEHVVVDDDLVLVQSGDGGVHAIRASGTRGAAAGTVAWSRTTPAATGPAWPPTSGPRLVFVTSRRMLHALDRGTGAVAWERTTGASTAAAAVQSGAWVYVPLENGRILRLPADPYARADSNGADAPPRDADDPDPPPADPPAPPESREPLLIDAGGHLDDSPVPVGGGVIWDAGGGLVALEPTPSRWLRHRFPLNTAVRQGPMVPLGSPVVRGDGIFVVTAHGEVARIALDAPGHPGLWAPWCRTLPDQPASGPLVGDDTVLVSLGPAGIVAFGAADGGERWRSDLVGTVVAAAAGRAWVLDETGRLTALDLTSGVRRGSWSVGCFTIPVVNSVSERIVLASPSGLVASLAPPVPAATPSPVTAAGDAGAEPGPADPGATPP